MHAIWGLGMLSPRRSRSSSSTSTSNVHDYEEVFFRVTRQRRSEARRRSSPRGRSTTSTTRPTLQFYGGKIGIDATHKGRRGHAAVAAGDRDERRDPGLVDPRWGEYGIGAAAIAARRTAAALVAAVATSLTHGPAGPFESGSRSSGELAPRRQAAPAPARRAIWPVGFADRHRLHLSSASS